MSDTHFIVRVEFEDGLFAHFVLDNFYFQYFSNIDRQMYKKNLSYCPQICRYFTSNDISFDNVKDVTIWNIHNC